MQIPYTYLIGWSDKNLFYYGSKYGSDADPKTLWKDYFTSSRYVKECREEFGEPDVIEVRRIFDSPHKAQEWEKKVLRRLDVLSKDSWLNKNVGGRIYLKTHSEEHIKKRTQNKNHHPKQKIFALKASMVAAKKKKR